MCMAPNCLLDRIAAADAARNAFVAQWGLDDKAQDLLVRLDHYTQQKVMNDFSQETFKAVNYAFMQAVERVVDRPIRCTGSRRVFGGDDEIEEFIRCWRLDNKEANTLYFLDPAKREEVKGLFSPRDLPLWASHVFIAFVFSDLKEKVLLSLPIQRKKGIA